MTWDIEGHTNEEAWTADLLDTILSSMPLPLPPREQRFGASMVEWWEGKPGDAIIMAHGGTVDDRRYAETLVGIQLSSHGFKRAQFTFEYPYPDGDTTVLGPEVFAADDESVISWRGENYYRSANTGDMTKTAGWPEIMAKAKRLIQSNQVTMLRNGWNSIVAHVIGDHGEYNCEIGRDDPNSQAITQWQCECPWDQYAWQRTRKWKKYEGRPCAHVLAAYWKSRGTPLDDYDPDTHGPAPRGQKIHPQEPQPSGAGPMGPSAISPLKGDVPTPPETPGPPHTPGPPQSPHAPSPFALGPSGPPGAQAPLTPPQPAGILPPSPQEQLQMMQPPAPGQTPGGMPSPPGSMSIPGAKPPSPFNPIQYPGGTYSNAQEGETNELPDALFADPTGQRLPYLDQLKNKYVQGRITIEEYEQELEQIYQELARRGYSVADMPQPRLAAEFNPPEIVRLKADVWGQAEGKSEAHGAGQYMQVPALKADGTPQTAEVLGQDETTGWVEIIIPLDEAGAMEPFLVRCFVEPNEIEHSRMRPPGPFIRRKR